MKVADNLDSHNISDKFEFQQDLTAHFGVTCPLVLKKPIFDFAWSITCLVLIETCR